MRDRIAVIGWGSLIWDLDDLAPHVAEPWALGAGPALPLEFSRISPKRRMGLVVCIDPDLGVPCPTHAIASRRTDPAEARADLARRERAPLDLIGWVCARSGRAEGRAADRVAAWCETTGAAGAVWTDLRPNWAEHRTEPFALAAAEAYLAALTGEARAEAVRYIESAPKETDTRLRRHLATRDWWREAAAALSRPADPPSSP
ncbi:MAG: hypothetical protein R6V44_07110 [Paracoccaceae bacterium]